jgi:hypothetical protein
LLSTVGCTTSVADIPEGMTELAAARTPLGFSKVGRSGNRDARISTTVLTSARLDRPALRAEGGNDVELPEHDRPLQNNGLCPPDMATIDDRFCVDRYEASLVEILPSGDERPWSPFQPAEGHLVRAVSEAHVIPQGYINAYQAAEACARSGKRLCRPAEWKQACMGPAKKTYGYANANEPRRCNDHGRSPVVAMFAGQTNLGVRNAWNAERMNNPLLNQLSGTLTPTGEHEGCTNEYGVYDMVGNIHEWVDDPRGTFLGGYYQDIHQNGDGCQYRTTAHEAWYHDYSTGFRCCADVAP